MKIFFRKIRIFFDIYRKLTLKDRILPFLTTFAQLSARLKNFLGRWLLVLGIKEGLVKCATVCVKSVVILIHSLNHSMSSSCGISTKEIWAAFFRQTFRAEVEWFLAASSTATVKVGFSQKVMAKFSNFSNCHSCEPKIVPVLLIPVNDNNIILAILWIVVVKKSPSYEIWLK